MKNRLMWFSLAALLIFAVFYDLPALAANKGYTGTLKEEDFKMAGLTLGQPFSDAKRVLGKPLSHKKAPEGDEYEEYYEYPKLTVGVGGFDVPLVAYICPKTSEYETFRGIKIGSSVKDVLSRYPKDQMSVYDGNYYYELNTESLANPMICFEVKSKVVSGIRLYLAWNL